MSALWRVAAAPVGLLVVPFLLLSAPAAQAAECPTSGGATVPEASATGEIVFKGHGWGHQMGMSQYGAQGAARLGCSAEQILERYYTDSAVTAAEMPSLIRLRMLDN